MNFQRYAIYYAPPAEAEWGGFATRWLGWDMATGAEVPHPEAPDLPLPVSEITATPRKYGLHATIKPPFRLAEGKTRAALEADCAALCADLAPVQLDGLALARLGRFLALRPLGETAALTALAARTVEALDAFRAPAPEAEVERRRAAGLTPAQEENLTRWGYPYVMDAFRFHITLSGKLAKPVLGAVEATLARDLAPLLPAPFEIADLALVGEDVAGQFHLIHRYTLSG
ncbi:DUF1045 domain-containing protein [Antarcticimicrobium sediminis]|uniref:DUF1045 domain-containing protein n=1 Tax=Antarcticimicrobium sediminis TaxID=2546227 RepID=A0A4V2Z853_9RHOB|nr:DUF1045 domain-containing protein [Antarcticimicrobium sediminis]TDE39066.1 DUF1045 domain-containing protein [Antarcticimicrobium sediminis]